MYVPSEFHGIYLKIQTHKDWPVSGYLVITNEKKEVQNFALSNHQTTALECTIPNVQSNRFCVCG